MTFSVWFLYSGFLANPAHRGSEVFKGLRCEFLRTESLLTAETLTGYPNKNSNDLNIANAQGMMGIVPLALSFLSLQPPYNTKRPLRRRD